MSWAYLLVFNASVGSRKEVQQLLDAMPEVTYWYGCLPNGIFLTSTLTARQISENLKERCGTSSGQRWFITQVHDDREGWLPKEAWHVLKNPDSPRMQERQ